MDSSAGEGNLILVCTGLPGGASCSFNPPNPNSLTTLSGTTYYKYGSLSVLQAACNVQPTSNTCPTGTTSGQSYTYDAVANRKTMVQYASGGNTTTTYAYNEDDELCWAFVGSCFALFQSW